MYQNLTAAQVLVSFLALWLGYLLEKLGHVLLLLRQGRQVLVAGKVEYALLELSARANRVGQALLNPLDDALRLCPRDFHARVVDLAPNLPEFCGELIDVLVELFFVLETAQFRWGSIVNGDIQDGYHGFEFCEVGLGCDAEVVFFNTFNGMSNCEDFLRMLAAKMRIFKQERNGKSPPDVVCPIIAD